MEVNAPNASDLEGKQSGLSLANSSPKLNEYLTWNCRGTNSHGFGGLINDISKEYDSSLMFLIDTHANSEAAAQPIFFQNELDFHCKFIVDARGLSRGIWCLWRS